MAAVLSNETLRKLTESSVAKGRKSIFITGAAAGIGLATAELFAGRGWYVGAYDVNVTGLDSLVRRIGADNCVAAVLDTTNMVAVQSTMSLFGQRTGFKLDVRMFPFAAILSFPFSLISLLFLSLSLCFLSSFSLLSLFGLSERGPARDDDVHLTSCFPLLRPCLPPLPRRSYSTTQV